MSSDPCRSRPTTRAPRSRSAFAAAAPMPVAAPVMMTRALTRGPARARCACVRAELVVAGVERRGAAAELERPVRPQRRVAAGLVEVPARAAGAPDGALHALVELGVVALLHLPADLDRLRVPLRAARVSASTTCAICDSIM